MQTIDAKVIYENRWTGPFRGPRGGQYWVHADTGSVEYGDRPGDEPEQMDEATAEEFFGSEAERQRQEWQQSPEYQEAKDALVMESGEFVALLDQAEEDFGSGEDTGAAGRIDEMVAEKMGVEVPGSEPDDIEDEVVELLHGTDIEFDEFKVGGHGVVYLSEKKGGRKTQAEHIAGGPFGGRLIRADVNFSKLNRFDPRNDPKAAEIMESAGIAARDDGTYADRVEYPDMGDIAPLAIDAGYSLFRVREPSVQGESWAISDTSAINITENEPYGDEEPSEETTASDISEVEASDVYDKPQKVTSTPEFKAWFGDSKVVDEEGEPLVVYHGTDKNFDEFQINMQTRADEPLSRKGIWFASSPVDAKRYGDNLQAVNLSVQNPEYLDVDDFLEWDDRFGGVRAKMTDADVERLIAEGHDGIVFSAATPEQDELLGLGGEWLNPQYVVFSPNQIKSATGNKGTFDPDDPRINYDIDEQDASEVYEQPSDDISPAKAEKMLEDGTAHGHPLTDSQKRMLHAASAKAGSRTNE